MGVQKKSRRCVAAVIGNREAQLDQTELSVAADGTQHRFPAAELQDRACAGQGRGAETR